MGGLAGFMGGGANGKMDPKKMQGRAGAENMKKLAGMFHGIPGGAQGLQQMMAQMGGPGGMEGLWSQMGAAGFDRRGN